MYIYKHLSPRFSTFSTLIIFSILIIFSTLIAIVTCETPAVSLGSDLIYPSLTRMKSTKYTDKVGTLAQCIIYAIYTDMVTCLVPYLINLTKPMIHNNLADCHLSTIHYNLADCHLVLTLPNTTWQLATWYQNQYIQLGSLPPGTIYTTWHLPLGTIFNLALATWYNIQLGTCLVATHTLWPLGNYCHLYSPPGNTDRQLRPIGYSI